MDKELIFIEGALLAFAMYCWFFVATNVNPLLGNIYTGLTALAFIVLILEVSWGKISIPLWNKTHNLFVVLVAVLSGYLALVFGGQLIVNYANRIPITDLLKLLASTAAPAFSQSSSINFFTFVVLVSFVETQGLFVRGFDLVVTFFNRIFKSNLEINKENLFKPSMWLIIFGIAFLFLLLHSTAKGITNSSALILVFLMAVISLILVCWFQEARIPILFHVVCNAIGYVGVFKIVGISLNILNLIHII